MMFVSQQVLGQRYGADGGSHDTELAQPALQAIPGHRIAAESAALRPNMDAELAQEQWSFDLRCGA